MIIERRRQHFDLSQFVNIENVRAFSGWRAIEKAVVAQPFTTFTNNNPIPAAEEPAFMKVTYQVADNGGFLPVPNDLLEDTPINLMAHISNWFAKKLF